MGDTRKHFGVEFRRKRQSCRTTAFGVNRPHPTKERGPRERGT